MAGTSRKKARKARKVKQDADGVKVTYPGRVIHRQKKPLSVTRRVQAVRCPYCKTEGRQGEARRAGSGSAPGTSVYVCQECCDPERGQPTRFLVMVKRED